MIAPQSHTQAVTAPVRGVEPLAWLQDVAVNLGRTPVLRDLDLMVQPGEVLGVAGANGSGKSTLLRVLATLVPVGSGTGQVLGASLGDRDLTSARRRICLIGHSAALYPQLTLADNLRFVARLTGRSDGDVAQALATVGLTRAADRRGEHCSQGMLRRGELARALLTEPMLLLLDEPHAGLDPASAALVDNVASSVCRRGGGCVLVSHEQDRLRTVADRTVECADGRTPLIDPMFEGVSAR